MNLNVAVLGDLTIESGASLTIANSSSFGVNVQVGASFTNNGTLNANNNIGARALALSGGSVTNNGLMNLDNPGTMNAGLGDGIFISNTSSLINTGHINIGPNLTQDGIEFSGGINSITNSGSINILGVGAGQHGIEDNSGGAHTVNNSGSLCINASGMEIQNENIALGITFTNTGTYNTSGCVATMPSTAVVPTLGEWGLLILALLIMIIGFAAATVPKVVLANGQSIGQPFSFQSLPFDARSYFQILPLVAMLVLGFFVVAILGFGYELTGADPFGAIVLVGLLSYLGMLLKQN